MNLVKPEYGAKSFSCPHCGVHAAQEWQELLGIKERCEHVPDLKRAVCRNCGKYSLWQNRGMVFPDLICVPEPNKDLQDGVKKYYREAKEIISHSPRGAAAILRLCLRELLLQLGEKGDDPRREMEVLVRRGLPIRLLQSLRLLRAIGPEAVRPGLIDDGDNEKSALKLFRAINLIAQSMLTCPREAEELYRSVPRSAAEEHAVPVRRGWLRGLRAKL